MLNPKTKFDDTLEYLSTIARVESPPRNSSWSKLLDHEDPFVRAEAVRWWRMLTSESAPPNVEPETLELRYPDPQIDLPCIRAKLVLLAAEGLSNDVIAARLDTPRQIISKWRHRFFDERLAGLDEEPRGGRPARFSPQRRR